MTQATWRFLMSALCMALVAACTPAGQPLPANPSQPWADAFNRGDAAALAALYTEDAMLMPPGGALVRGKAAIEAQLAKEATGEFKFEITSLETGSQGDIGYNVGTFRVIGADGATVDTGKFVEVWKRSNGDWKIHADIYNSDTPPPAPAAPAAATEPAAETESPGQ